MYLDNTFIRLFVWVCLPLLEIFKAFFVLRICIDDPFYIKKEVHLSTYVVGMIASITCFFLGASYNVIGTVVLFTTVAGMLFAINDTIFNKLWTTTTVYVFVSTINSIPASLLNHFCDFTDETNDFLVHLCVIPLLAIVYHMRYHSHRFDTILDKYGIQLIKIILLLSAFYQCLSAAALININSKNLFHSNVSYICVILLCALTWYVLNLHKRITELSTEQKVMLTAQKEYYLTLLAKEEETRRYRHDMNNHLMCMSALLDKNDSSGLKEYLSNLQEEFKTVGDSVYQTGNTVLTAITAYYLPMVDDNTTVNISGKLTKEFNLSNTDICTVYSNLIKNSIEELQRIDPSEPKELNIEFKNGNNFGQIKVSNSMRDPSSFRGLASKTVKEDKDNHGFGLQNINRIVNKNKGTFDIKKENDRFCCEVVFPIH